MMKRDKNPSVSFRLTEQEYAELDRLAEHRGCSRSEAMRLIFHLGLPAAQTGVRRNHGRIAELLEYIGVTMGVVISRDHPDYVEVIERVSRERMAEYHG